MSKIIEFDKLIIKNFGTYEDATLDLAALGLGVHFVMGENKMQPRLGSNGAGKTTLWNAMCWGLFGKTLDELRTPDVVPWGTKLKPEVMVVVYIGTEGSKLRGYKISRSGRTNGLWINGKVVQQETIDKLLGMTFATFQHTIMLGQKQPLFFDLGNVDKMDILTQVLDLTKWEDRAAAASKKHKGLVDNITKLRFEQEALQKTLEDARVNLTDLKTRSREWERQRIERARSRETEISKLEKLMNAAEREFGDHDLTYDGAETELRACRKTTAKLAAAVATASRDVLALKAQLKVYNKNTDDAEAAFAAARKGKNCPTCGQPISKAASHDHVDRLRKAARQAARAVELQLVEISKADETLQKADKALEQAQKHEAEWLVKSNEAIDKREHAQTRLLDCKAQLAAFKSIGETDTPNENPHHELIERARVSIKKHKDTLAEIEIVAQEAATLAERVKYWVQGFKLVRLYLLKEMLDELEAVTYTLLPAIGLDGWGVRYDMERENKQGRTTLGLNVVITSPKNDKAVKWKSFSGGEGQRLRLIGAIALSEVLMRRAGVTCELLVLDEPTKHMSAQGVSETVEFLIERGREQQIMYCDHTTAENARFTSTVKVVKNKKGVTSVVAPAH